MDLRHAVELWNAAIYHYVGVDQNGNEAGNYTAFGGAALANRLWFLSAESNGDKYVADRKVAAEFLREMADALEGK